MNLDAGDSLRQDVAPSPPDPLWKGCPQVNDAMACVHGSQDKMLPGKWREGVEEATNPATEGIEVRAQIQAQGSSRTRRPLQEPGLSCQLFT
jgi:hypothetical protein